MAQRAGASGAMRMHGQCRSRHIVSGILGSVMMVGLIFLIGFGIKAIRKKGT